MLVIQPAAASAMPALSAVPIRRTVRQSRLLVPGGHDPVSETQSRLRVFLVEDSVLFRERLTEKLESTGNISVVGSADSEQSAIASLQTCTWDVMVLDLHLKPGSGLGVLRALQEV